MKRLMVSMAALTAFIAGCTGAVVPQCDDPAVKETLQTLFWEGAERLTLAQGITQEQFAEAKKKFEVSIDAIRPSAVEKEIAKVTCGASMTVKVRQESLPNLAQGFKSSNASEIDYSAQITTDGKTRVETGMFRNPTEFVASLVSMGALK